MASLSKQQPSDKSTPPKVGEQIQRLRMQHKLTLEDLSRAAGVSKSMLSEIERNKANPTIAVAWRLTNALGISLDQLFSGNRHEPAIQVIGQHEIPTLSSESHGYQLRVLGPIELAGKFEWYELTLKAEGALVSNPHEPGTNEHLTVLHGTVEVEVQAQLRKLRTGETARYRADVAHAIRNAGRSDVRALLIVEKISQLS